MKNTSVHSVKSATKNSINWVIFENTTKFITTQIESNLNAIFAEFYLSNGILPKIIPMPKKFYSDPKLLPNKLIATFSKQGLLIYDSKA